jgi:hypothetical protein
LRQALGACDAFARRQGTAAVAEFAAQCRAVSRHAARIPVVNSLL